MADTNASVKNDVLRINKYKRNQQLFEGQHFAAFNIKSENALKEAYDKLRYVAVNFAGMLSRLAADSLFGYEEYPSISFTDEKTEEWYEKFDASSNISTQLYESAMENSFRGDALFRLRAEGGVLLFEDVNPETWTPIYSTGNVRKAPTGHILQWTDESTSYVDAKGKPQKIYIQEKHTKGLIEVTAFLCNSKEEVTTILSDEETKKLGYEPYTKTKIDDLLLFHVPNWRINTSIFGIDDYRDIEALMFAINNRLSKVDNVLDKHGDPILAVPDGVLDQEGKVAKGAFGLIEMGTGESGAKPEYIVWDAKLDSSFAEIERLVEFLFMTSETSPAAFGLDKDGQADSGRALKFKMLRTIAKKHRKQVYYDAAMKSMIYVAQKFAKANGLTVDGVKFSGEPERPQIEWTDGIVNDPVEVMDIQERRLDAGLTSRVDMLMHTDGLSRKQAEQQIADADEDKAKRAPSFSANPFNKNDPNNA